jgi:hypothetical protein
VKALNQRTIVFKLVESVVICFLCLEHCRVTDPDFQLSSSRVREKIISLEKEQNMLEQTKQNRVLSRVGARELTREEVEAVAAGTTTGCRGTSLHKGGPIVDVLCDPS